MGWAVAVAQGIGMGLQAYSKYRGARAEEKALELEQLQDDTATIAREADRKRNLARILASQNADALSRGVESFEGSPLTIMKDSIEEEAKVTEREEYERRIRRQARHRQKRAIMDQMYLSAVSGLLMQGGQMGQSLGGGGKTSGTGGAVKKYEGGTTNQNFSNYA